VPRAPTIKWFKLPDPENKILSQEDFKDFLRQHNLPIWDKADPRVISIRNYREDLKDQSGNIPAFYHQFLDNPESFANLMIVLLYKENYLLDQLIRSQEQKFITESGYTENLFRKRLTQRNPH
jgi:four helix bundle suffix protein